MRWSDDLRDSPDRAGCCIVLLSLGALMRFKPKPTVELVKGALLLGAVSLLTAALAGCHPNTRQDTLIQSLANPSRTLRATVILRQYYVDGKLDTSPTTYVLLDPYTAKPDYDNGTEFKDSQVVIKPSQCGPLSLEWVDDGTLKVICEKCGISLAAVGDHPSGVGSVRIQYEGFPEMSSWETAPHRN
jgi:hypothetical protein